MLKFLNGIELAQDPKLSHSMFEDRTYQFKTRLKWDVTIDERGLEKDQYDLPRAIYVVETDNNGHHLGSMRFLPMNRATMLSDVFDYLLPEQGLKSAEYWECTRFCIGQNASRTTAAKVLGGGAKLLLELKLSGFLGVFDRRMLRCYRMLGALPEVLATRGNGASELNLGKWSFDSNTFRDLMTSAALSSDELELSFVNSSLLLNDSHAA